MDGILGMAYDTIAVNKLPTLMQALKTQNLIDANVVTFRLSNTAAESDMIVGGEDAS